MNCNAAAITGRFNIPSSSECKEYHHRHSNSIHGSLDHMFGVYTTCGVNGVFPRPRQQASRRDIPPCAAAKEEKQNITPYLLSDKALTSS